MSGILFFIFASCHPLSAFFEFVGQFSSGCMHYFSKRCWRFWDSTQYLLVLGSSTPFFTKSWLQIWWVKKGDVWISCLFSRVSLWNKYFFLKYDRIVKTRIHKLDDVTYSSLLTKHNIMQNWLYIHAYYIIIIIYADLCSLEYLNISCIFSMLSEKKYPPFHLYDVFNKWGNV